MFFSEARFTENGFDYVLVERGHKPLAHGLWSFELVAPDRAEAIVVRMVIAHAANPDWRLLRFIGITEHPANLSASELKRMVERRLRGIFSPDLYRRTDAPRIAKAEPTSPPKVPAKLLASTDASHYFVAQSVTPTGAPVSGVRLELVCAGGEVRTTATGPDGCVRVDRLEAAPVTVRVVSLDGSMWRALSGEPARPSSEEATVRWHEVMPGECLSKVAHLYGIRGWKLLWEHEKNAPLRAKRRSPHVLMPGDQVAVPGVRVNEIVRPVDATHVIEVRPAPERRVRVRFQNLAGEPLPDLSYRYKVAGRQEPGTAPTNAEGWLEERVPLATAAIELELAAGQPPLAIALDALRPIRDEDTRRPIDAGVHRRLTALGYEAGAPTDTPTPQLERALQTFQSLAMKHEEPTGEPDEQTVSELARVALV